MKLVASSSYGYQIMDRSRHTVTKYSCDGKVHAAINKMFKRLNIVDEKLYEVELVKSEIEHRKPIFVGFFILQYAELRMLEVYHNLFVKYCDVTKFEELERDTDSLYLALAEEELYDCIRPDKERKWIDFRSPDCADDFIANAVTNFFPVLAAQNTRNMTSANLDSSKKNLVAKKCCVCAAVQQDVMLL